MIYCGCSELRSHVVTVPQYHTSLEIKHHEDPAHRPRREGPSSPPAHSSPAYKNPVFPLHYRQPQKAEAELGCSYESAACLGSDMGDVIIVMELRCIRSEKVGCLCTVCSPGLGKSLPSLRG